MIEIKDNKEFVYFAGGCFWGVEYYFKKIHGVISVVSGYMGGNHKNPKYEDVCTGNTGHAETIEIVFDNKLTNFETLARVFFEIHDFTQIDRQGPDTGTQYRSVIFFKNNEHKNIATNLIDILESKGYKVATKLEPASEFWKAESYHQDYYFKKGTTPYCHFRKKIWEQ